MSTYLSLRTSLTTIETALRDTIRDGLGKCPTVASLAALQALASPPIHDGAQRYVTATGTRYRFSRYSTATDDGSSVLKPGDVATTAAGRWLLTATTSATGYLRAVELYDGDSTPESLLTRLTGVKPGVVIVYDRDDFTNPTNIAGNVYVNNYDFDVWCVSSNLRPEHQTAIGSAIAAEAAEDPGVNKITGDLAYLLAGNQIGLDPAVRWVEILGRQRQSTSLADRLMVYGLKVRVYASVHLVEDDGSTTDLTSLAVQEQKAGEPTTTLTPVDILSTT